MTSSLPTLAELSRRLTIPDFLSYRPSGGLFGVSLFPVCFWLLVKKQPRKKGHKTKTKYMKTNKTQPAHQIRSRSIKCAVWKNESANGSFFTLTLERLWKDGEVWKSARSFGLGDTVRQIS